MPRIKTTKPAGEIIAPDSVSPSTVVDAPPLQHVHENKGPQLSPEQIEKEKEHAILDALNVARAKYAREHGDNHHDSTNPKNI